MDKSLLTEPILILDGGLGTTLEEEHLVKFSSTSTPLWSSHLLVSSPKLLLDTQAKFARAGADILLTATYQASFQGFAITPRNGDQAGEPAQDLGYARNEAELFMCSAVDIARSAFNAAGRQGLVALSLGAYGAVMIPSQEYSGAYTGRMLSTKDLYGFHLDRLGCFTQDIQTWEKIDLVAFETLPRVSEVRAVRATMHEVKSRGLSEKPFWISCVFPNDNERLPDGSTVSAVVEAMLSSTPPTEDDFKAEFAAPYAIGINCTKVHKLRDLLQQFEVAAGAQSMKLPRLVIYPDGASNLVYDTTSQQWVARSEADINKGLSQQQAWHEEVGQIVGEVHDRGAWQGIIVGGCCKSTPQNIARLRSNVDRIDKMMRTS